MSKYDFIRITIEGPGETFGGITLAVKAALEAEGCKVKAVDEYPPKMSLQEFRDRKLQFEDRDVRIVTDHQPWGG